MSFSLYQVAPRFSLYLICSIRGKKESTTLKNFCQSGAAHFLDCPVITKSVQRHYLSTNLPKPSWPLKFFEFPWAVTHRCPHQQHGRQADTYFSTLTFHCRFVQRHCREIWGHTQNPHDQAVLLAPILALYFYLEPRNNRLQVQKTFEGFLLFAGFWHWEALNKSFPQL
jgi:hypothetical protein